MTMKELSRKSDKELDDLQYAMTVRGNMNAAARISEVREFYHKTVKVVKGRKVPIGTVGECFWMDAKCYSRYGDPWGIYTRVMIGIKDESGSIYWTALDNIERVK